MMRDRWQAVGWLALLAGVLVWFFHESFLQGRSLVPTDLMYQILLPYSASVTNVTVANHYTTDALTLDYPWGVFWQQTVKTGQLPLWNPYIFGGHPILAESMPAMLSPFKLLYLAFSAERAFTLGLILEFFLTALFMFAFLRELERSRCAAFIGSCAWALNSGFIMWYWRMVPAFCLAPLVLLLIERAVKRNAWRFAAGAGAVLGVAVLCGNVQGAVHLGFLVMAWWSKHVFESKRLWRLAVLCFIVAAAIAAVQWLPTLELMRLDAYNSTQARNAAAGLRHSLVGLPALITFVFPGLTGSTESYDLLRFAYASRYDFTGYIGIVPFALAILAVRERRLRWLGWIIVAVIVIVLFTPLVRYLYHRFFIVAVFVGCVLAAEGADLWLAQPRLFPGLLIIGAVVAAIVITIQIVVAVKHDALVAAAHAMVDRKIAGHSFSYKTAWFHQRILALLDHYRITNIEFWLPLACLAVLTVIVRRDVSPALACCALVGLTVTDLTVLGRRLLPQIDLVKYPLATPHPTLEPVESDTGLFRVYVAGTNNIYTHRPDWLMNHHIADLSGNASLVPAGLEWLLRRASSTDNSNLVLNLGNVKYVFIDEDDQLPADQYEFLTKADGLRVYRNRDCLPRALFISRAKAITNHTQLISQVFSDRFNPREVIYLEEPSPLASSSTEITGTAEVATYSPLRVDVRVQCSQPGWLLLTDTYYPGWTATVAGQPTRIYRADGVFRGVIVPAGEHTVEFRFRPRSFMVGAAISFTTLLMLVVAASWRVMKPPSRSPSG
jgi:hypothetical protein